MRWQTRETTGKSTFSEVSDIALAAHGEVRAAEYRPPVIAVSGKDSTSKSVTAMMQMIRTLGAEPLFVANFKERIKGGVEASVADVLTKVDGVVVMGNDEDIDPASYGKSVHPATKIEQCKARAAFERELICQAVAQKMPVLGICGGMQRINVAFGGTLHQHVPDLIGGHHHAQNEQNVPGFIPVQEVEVRGGTALAGMLGALNGKKVLENSFHHQALDEVAEGFRVNAVASDGIAEGFEARPGGRFGDQFVMGVQFHPEFAASEVGPRLASHLIGASHAFAQKHDRVHQPAEAMVESLRSSLPDIQVKREAVRENKKWVMNVAAQPAQNLGLAY